MKPRRPTIKDSVHKFHSKRRSEQVAARAARKAAAKKAKFEALNAALEQDCISQADEIKG